MYIRQHYPLFVVSSIHIILVLTTLEPTQRALDIIVLRRRRNIIIKLLLNA